MSDTRINLTGGKAALVIAVLILIAVIQFTRLQMPVDEESKDAVRILLSMEYAGESGEWDERAEPGAPTSESFEKPVRNRQGPDNVSITSFKARKSGKDVIVRVEFAIDGKAKEIRYFHMQSFPAGQRKIKGETSALSYYATFW